MEEHAKAEQKPQTTAPVIVDEHHSNIGQKILYSVGVVVGSLFLYSAFSVGQAVQRASTPDVPEVDKRSPFIEGALSKIGLPVPSQEDGQEITRPGMADVRNKGTAIIWLCTDQAKGEFNFQLHAITSQPNGIEVVIDKSDRDQTGRVSVAETHTLQLNTNTEANAFVAYSESACNNAPTPPAPNRP